MAMSKRSGGEKQEDIWIAHTELAVQKLQLGVRNQPPQRPALPDYSFCRRGVTPRKTPALGIHELGQTYNLPFLRKPAYFNDMATKARVLLPDLGQTALWPNTC